MLAADGRVSTGRYVSNRASNKICALNDNVYYLRSGSAPDTQAVAEVGALRHMVVPSHDAFVLLAHLELPCRHDAVQHLSRTALRDCACPAEHMRRA